MDTFAQTRGTKAYIEGERIGDQPVIASGIDAGDVLTRPVGRSKVTDAISLICFYLKEHTSVTRVKRGGVNKLYPAVRGLD